jgi:hypothetical protein
MKLPDRNRASLASRLLDPLPTALFDGNEGFAEALHR